MRLLRTTIELLSVCSTLALVLSSFALAQRNVRRPAATPVTVASSTARNIGELQRLFLQPPDDSRIMMRWWWFGPTVTRRGLEREMRLMKEGGIGGFEVQPVYPLALEGSDGIKNQPFLSDEFIDALRFTNM